MLGRAHRIYPLKGVVLVQFASLEKHLHGNGICRVGKLWEHLESVQQEKPNLLWVTMGLPQVQEEVFLPPPIWLFVTALNIEAAPEASQQTSGNWEQAERRESQQWKISWEQDIKPANA